MTSEIGTAPIPSTMSGLTGVRGVAALWVVASHVDALACDPRIGFGAVSHFAAAAGWIGVDLFFILSGFVLMHAHARDFAASPLDRTPAFLLARFFRVYPLNAVVLGLIAAIVLLDPAFAAMFRAAAPGNLSPAAFLRTLTLSTRWFAPEQGDWNQPVWSLSVELLGYLAFPAIAFFSGKIRSFRIALLGAILPLLAFGCVQEWLGLTGENLILGKPVVLRLGCEFTAGCLLYAARVSVSAGLAARAGWMAPVAAGGVVLSIVAGSVVAMPMLFALLIFGLSFEAGDAVDRLMRSRPAVFLGRVSFPLYLVHLMLLAWIFDLVHRAHLPSPAAALAAVVGGLGCVLLVSWLLHLYVERSSTRMARLSYRLLSPAAGGGLVGSRPRP